MKPTRDDLLAVIRELADKAVPKVAQRNAAYAGSGDVFGNLNLVETLSNGRLSTELGITLRMGDKVSRLYSLCADPTIDPTDEPLEDTLIDLLGYSALLLLRHRTRTSLPTKKLQQLTDDVTEYLRQEVGKPARFILDDPEKELTPKLQELVMGFKNFKSSLTPEDVTRIFGSNIVYADTTPAPEQSPSCTKCTNP